MSVVRRVTKNTILLNTARIVSTLGKFFLFIWVARELGDGVLGQFTFAIIFTSFFAIAISLGMDDYLVREVARDTDASSKYVNNMTTIRLLFSILIFAAMVIVINLMDQPQDTRLAVYIFGGYTVFTAFSFLYRANFRAFERMEWDALLEVLEAVVTTGLGLAVLLLGYGLIALSLVFLASSVLNLVVSLIVSGWRFVMPRFAFDARFLKTAIIKSAPFSVFALFLIYPRIDTILLSSMKGDEVVGNYNAAYQIVVAFSPIVMNFMIALVPLISRYYIDSRAMLSFTFEKSYKYLVLIGFPVSVGGMVLADRIIPLLYGPGFEDAVLALQILVWNCLLLAVNRPMFYLLGAINRQGTCALITMGALVASIALNFYAVPRWGFIGSGGITLFVGLLVTMAAWMATNRFGFRLPLFKHLWAPALSSAGMGAIVYLVDAFTGPGLPVLIGTGVVSYAVLLLVFRGISGDDIVLMKQALRLAGKHGEQQDRPVKYERENQAGIAKQRPAER